MSEMLKSVAVKFVLPLLVPVLVGFGSAVIGSLIATEQIKARVAHLEVQINRHESALNKEFSRHEQNTKVLSDKTEDQEKRLTRLEVLFGECQKTLAEIRDDLKTLIRASKK